MYIYAKFDDDTVMDISTFDNIHIKYVQGYGIDIIKMDKTSENIHRLTIPHAAKTM